jgi:GGDEF domain-containing protein
MSISIGACYWKPSELPDAEALYRTVDNCLYKAKEARNALVVCDLTTKACSATNRHQSVTNVSQNNCEA